MFHEHLAAAIIQITLARLAFACSKSTKKHVNELVVVPLLLALNRFDTLFWCFHCQI